MNSQKTNSPYFHTWSAQDEALQLDFLSAKGSFIELQDHPKLLDSTSTSYHVSFGHQQKEIISAVQNQLKDFAASSPKFKTELKSKASLELLDLIGAPGRIFYTLSGSEAVENAIKMARDLKGALIIAARKKSYHGASLGALSITGDWRNEAVATVDDWTLRIPECYEDHDGSGTIEILDSCGPSKVAAICLETVTGNNGVYVPSKEYLQNIFSYCKKNQIFTILDEVICGFYRCGQNFAFQDYNVTPDFLCLAKSITGGLTPLGALWVKEEHAQKYDQKVLPCGLTNYANPLGLAALRAVYQILNDQSFLKVIKSGKEHFKELMKKLSSHREVLETRSTGHLAILELSKNVDFKLLLKHGLYGIAKDKQILLSPQLLMSTQELDLLFERLENILGDLYAV